MLDVRNPIGYLFLLLGAMIAVWGYTHPLKNEYITATGFLPINMNIPWGILMVLFGMIMVSLARLDKVNQMQKEASGEASSTNSSAESSSDSSTEPKNGKIES